MPNQEFKPERHQAQTERQLIIFGVVLTIIIGLGFSYVFFGVGATVLAAGTFLAIGAMIVLVWLALKLIEWVGGKEE